jgi:hypothetical protein
LTPPWMPHIVRFEALQIKRFKRRRARAQSAGLPAGRRLQ